MPANALLAAAAHFNHVLTWFTYDELSSFLTNTLQFSVRRHHSCKMWQLALVGPGEYKTAARDFGLELDP